MLYCDSTYAALLFIYVGFAIIKLIWSSWKHSRFEAKAHMVYFVASSLGLLTALPLIVDNLIVFSQNTADYSEMRLPSYEDFVAKVLPSLVYFVTKKNEDCFNCFNRLAPNRFSIFQFSKSEIKICSKDPTNNPCEVGLNAIQRSTGDSRKIDTQSTYYGLLVNDSKRGSSIFMVSSIE